MEVVFFVFVLCAGAFSLLCAIYDWEFEFMSWKERSLESKFGPFGIRVFRFVAGAIAIVIGILGLLGMIE